MCNLKPRVGTPFVTQFVHEKLYKFIKNQNRTNSLRNCYNCIIVYYGYCVKNNLDLKNFNFITNSITMGSITMLGQYQINK